MGSPESDCWNFFRQGHNFRFLFHGPLRTLRLRKEESSPTETTFQTFLLLHFSTASCLILYAVETMWRKEGQRGCFLTVKGLLHSLPAVEAIRPRDYRWEEKNQFV